MRTINKMVIQPNTPNDNKVLWLNKNNASYYNNGTWVTIGESSEDRKELEEKLNKKANKVDMDVELNKKFDKESVLQTTGDAEDKVMSQKATTTAISDETTRAKAAEKTNAETITNEVARLDEKIDDKTNLADDEDLTSVDNGTGSNVLKFADRTYNTDNFSGKGYKILRKNVQSVNIASTKINITEVPSSDGTLSFTINGKETQIDVSATTDNTTTLVAQKVVSAFQESMTEYKVSVDASLITLIRKSSDSVTPSVFSASTTGVVCTILDSTKRELRNILTSAMINQPDTIYEIRYDFDLNGENIKMQDGCTLKFEGGSLKNGSIIGNNTRIDSSSYKIFETDLDINGNWNTEWMPEWFGAKGDGITDDSLAVNLTISKVPINSNINLYNNYLFNSGITINRSVNIRAYGIIKSTCYQGPTILIDTVNYIHLYIKRLENVSNKGLIYTEDNNYNYIVGIALRNSMYNFIEVEEIRLFSTGVFLLGDTTDTIYNYFILKRFAGTFNPIRITSNNGGAVNANVFSDIIWNYYSWNKAQLNGFAPYMIVSNSFTNTGTPYSNNSNIFKNLMLEFHNDYSTIGNQQPKVIKASYCNGYQLYISRIEVSRYKDEPKNKLATLGTNVQYMYANVEFIWGELDPITSNYSIFVLHSKPGDQHKNENVELLDVQINTLLNWKFGNVIVDKINRICNINISLNNMSEVIANTKVITNLPKPLFKDYTLTQIVGYAKSANSYNYWENPEVDLQIPFRVDSTGSLIIDKPISTNHCTTFNFMYYF